jgi:hypothetical protein
MPDFKGRSLYLAGILVIVATVAILYLIFVPSNGSAISQLVTSHSTTQLFRATLTVLGANGALLFLGGFFASSAFFAAIPSAGAFSSQGPRIAGLFFLQQIVYWPLIFVFLISPYSFLAVLPYYLALAIPMTFALKPLGRDLTYEEFAQSKSGQWGPTMALTSRKFLASNILSSVITFELLFYLVRRFVNVSKLVPVSVHYSVRDTPGCLFLWLPLSVSKREEGNHHHA